MERNIRIGAPIALMAFLMTAAALLAVLAITPQAHAAQEYAQLAGKYESNNNPSYANYAASGAGSVVGEYGAYQFQKGNAYKYAQWLQTKASKKYKSWGNALVAAYKKDGSKCGYYFDATWRYLAGNASTTQGSAVSDTKTNAWRIKKVKAKMKKLGYAKQSNGDYIYMPAKTSTAWNKALNYQYKFSLTVYYNPAVKLWESAVPAFDVDDYSVALRNVLYSTSIQHGAGGSKSIFVQAVRSADGFANIADEEKLIVAIYNERARATKDKPSDSAIKIKKANLTTTNYKRAKKYGLTGKYLAHFYSNSANVQVSVFVRLYVNEKADALALYDQICKHSKTTGGKIIASYASTDTTHKEKVSAKVCKTCGATVKKAYTRTVKTTYKRSGKKYVNAAGRTYVVHFKGYYKVKATTLNVRSKASSKGALKTTLSKGKVVRVTSVKTGSDGYWWGKLKASGKTGWVQMQYLSSLGTASKHSYSGGKCKYCGISKATAKRISKIVTAVKKKGKRSCTFVKQAKVYKNAYAVSKEAVKTCEKGAKLTVIKVVKNVYNDYWALTSSGSYIDLSCLK